MAGRRSTKTRATRREGGPGRGASRAGGRIAQAPQPGGVFEAVSDPTRRAILDHLRDADRRALEAGAGKAADGRQQPNRAGGGQEKEGEGGGGVPAGVIAAMFPMSRPAISRHLRVLRRANLVVEHRVGRRRLYTLNAEPLRHVDDWLVAYRLRWSARLFDLKHMLEEQS